MSDGPKCCICLDDFTNPVSVPCGHCFCLSCIGEYWRVQGACQCPLCKACFSTRPQLRTLETDFSSCDGNVCAENQLQTRPDPPQTPDQSPVPLRAGEVSCDLCPVQCPAVKSCVECLASYCEFHLRPHYQDPAFERHLLVNVVKNLAEPVCRLHGKQLQQFCRTDQTCICAMCARTDHRGHHVISIKREATKKKVQLKRRRTKLQQKIQERLCEVEKLESTTTGQTQSHSKELIKELVEDISELQTRNDELERLLQTEDSLHFLQRFLLTASL